MRIKYDIGNVVIINQGENKGIVGIVKSHKNDIVSIDDGNGGILTVPESYLDGINREQFIRMLIFMYNEMFNAERLEDVE